jgi:transposase
LSVAQEWIINQTHQLSVFPNETNTNILLLDQCEFLGVHQRFLYEILSKLQQRIGYLNINAPMLNDLVTIRVIEPASKLRSIELIETYFGTKHRRQSFYEAAPKWLALKEEVEQQTVRFAEKEFNFDYTLMFYDVTTLYFETFEADELRKPGFSKDNKFQQPQIVVALMVTKEGFPIAYEIFPGNTFEGHTIIPVIQSFIKKHRIKNFTVVADAAMISAENIQNLKEAKVHYIVGGRLGNLPTETLQQIDQKLIREDGRTIRLNTDKGFLVCSYSQKRFKKDNYEMEKQIEKAKDIITYPSKSKKTKFVKAEQQKMVLNENLITKTKLLLGLKGYYTDLEENTADNKTIIERYHDLYKIEQAFRLSKNDLQTRPIFHFKEDPIKLHALICFMALAVSKYIELKTDTSLRAFLTECKKITDARMLNKITKTVTTIRAKIPPSIKNLLSKLELPH